MVCIFLFESKLEGTAVCSTMKQSTKQSTTRSTFVFLFKTYDKENNFLVDTYVNFQSKQLHVYIFQACLDDIVGENASC